MKNMLFAATTVLGLANSGNAQISDAFIDTNNDHIHAIISNPNEEIFASTFSRNPSKPMPGEGEYRLEVCGAIEVQNLPDDIQELIRSTWGDVEMVRECTTPDIPMHDY